MRFQQHHKKGRGNNEDMANIKPPRFKRPRRFSQRFGGIHQRQKSRYAPDIENPVFSRVRFGKEQKRKSQHADGANVDKPSVFRNQFGVARVGWKQQAQPVQRQIEKQ